MWKHFITVCNMAHCKQLLFQSVGQNTPQKNVKFQSKNNKFSYVNSLLQRHQCDQNVYIKTVVWKKYYYVD